MSAQAADPDAGLSAAQAAQRLAEDGANALPGGQHRSLLSIAADTAEQDEGSSRDGPTEFRFTVTRQPAVNYTEVNYRVVHGTTNADDFLTSSTTGTVTFADGQSSKPVSIRVMADLVVEANERFSVELHDPMNGTLLTRTATMTILGDDAGPLEPTLYAA